MSQSMLDRALGRLSTQGILIYVAEDGNTDVFIESSNYYQYYDIFVKKSNRAWRYGLARAPGTDHLAPDMEIPVSDLTKIMLWENAQVIKVSE